MRYDDTELATNVCSKLTGCEHPAFSNNNRSVCFAGVVVVCVWEFQFALVCFGQKVQADIFSKNVTSKQCPFGLVV